MRKTRHDAALGTPTTWCGSPALRADGVCRRVRKIAIAALLVLSLALSPVLIGSAKANGAQSILNFISGISILLKDVFGQSEPRNQEDPSAMAAKVCGGAIQLWRMRMWNTCSKSPQNPSLSDCKEPGDMAIVDAKVRGRDGFYDVTIEFKANDIFGAGRCIVDDGIATPTRLSPRWSGAANPFGPDPPEASRDELVDRCLEMYRGAQVRAYMSCQKFHAMQLGNQSGTGGNGAPAVTNPPGPTCTAPRQPTVTGAKIRGGDGVYAVLLEWQVDGEQAHGSACCTFAGGMRGFAPTGSSGSHCRQ